MKNISFRFPTSIRDIKVLWKEYTSKRYRKNIEVVKYIDAEKLKAEIRIIQQSLEHRDVYLNQVKKIRTECMIEFCKCIFDVITSLQEEQSVDIEE